MQAGDFQKDFLLHTAAEAGRLAGHCAAAAAAGDAPSGGELAEGGALLLEPADDISSGVVALVRFLYFQGPHSDVRCMLLSRGLSKGDAKDF